MTHELKILPKYMKAVKNGTKRFELRKDDRGYKVGDWLRLREWENGRFTGEEVFASVNYILRDCPEYGLKDGFCILNIAFIRPVGWRNDL